MILLAPRSKYSSPSQTHGLPFAMVKKKRGLFETKRAKSNKSIVDFFNRMSCAYEKSGCLIFFLCLALWPDIKIMPNKTFCQILLYEHFVNILTAFSIFKKALF